MKEILIVEDDITMNKMLSDLLVHEGYKITSVYTAREAQSCLLSSKYHLASVDLLELGLIMAAAATESTPVIPLQSFEGSKMTVETVPQYM